MKAVIIAAGISSRLTEATQGTSKALLPLGSGTILSKILTHFSLCGIDEFCIVVGHQSEKLIRHVEERKSYGFRITFIENPEWKRGNGISVLAAEPAVKGEDFILSMSDHIIPPAAMSLIIRSGITRNALLVDAQVDRIFDIDDATKVWVEGDSILKIGKELREYNAIDCGIFRLNGRFFDSMRGQLERGKESISAAVEGLIQKNDMAAVFMEKGGEWIDIDTPEAYRHALNRYPE
jgi:choline kinase